MRIIAHRGASQEATENTLEAIALAARQGADACEVDVQATLDQHAVVFHDFDLKRLCGDPRLVRRLPLAELRRHEVAGAPIPTLEDVLAARERPDALVLELKAEPWNDVVVGPVVARAIRRTNALARGPIVISSFHPFCLMTLRRYAPELPRALLSWSGHPLPLRRAWARWLVGASELHIDAARIDEGWVRRAHRARRRIVAWTVNEADEARRLADLGVDGIITDVPGVLREALRTGPGARPS